MKKSQIGTERKPIEIKEDESILQSINDYYSRN